MHGTTNIKYNTLFNPYFRMQTSAVGTGFLKEYWRLVFALDILPMEQGLIMHDAHPVDHESIDSLPFLLTTLSRETSLPPRLWLHVGRLHQLCMNRATVGPDFLNGLIALQSAVVNN